MNYYLLQSKYFLIFIVLAALAFSVIPTMKRSFADTSDKYVISRMNRIQSEMFFEKLDTGSYERACYSGSVGIIINDLVQEYGKKVVCRTNKPRNSKMFVYVELQSGSFYSVDSRGVTCELITEPKTSFQCKDF